jgi:hypothetical protein
MNGAHLPGSAAAASTAPGNGTHRAAKRISPAPFAAIEASPIDAPMWPQHGAVWFEPKRVPSAPFWSSLAIERHSRIPAPGFLDSDPALLNRADSMNVLCDALPPAARPEVPRSGLAPLGWDPRVVCRKEGSE